MAFTKKHSVLVLGIALALGLSPNVAAAANETAKTRVEEWHAHNTQHRRNEIGLFLGMTAGGASDEGGAEERAGTIGVEYRRRLSPLIGVGLLAEYAGLARRDDVLLVPVTFWLTRRTEFIVAAGMERSEGTELFDAKTDPLGRISIGYSIHASPRRAFRPEFSVDWVDGELIYVGGFSFGWLF